MKEQQKELRYYLNYLLDGTEDDYASFDMDEEIDNVRSLTIESNHEDEPYNIIYLGDCETICCGEVCDCSGL
ncbi:Hypothetical predicted protein [Octopus vulgaris]|uniref:Uncharacterized protein n=1 Tax=Octopus vulgaris TaxID=6645 RepID=A0AA36F790_OCTVU|nr:Hypothetical predicted protein [Octopus vulgaris]